MKKILITAALIAWAGTVYGAYAWGTRTEAPDIWQATMCSMGQKEFQDAGRALDKVITIETVSLPLRAWAREYSDGSAFGGYATSLNALVEEAAFQERRLELGIEWMAESCVTED